MINTSKIHELITYSAKALLSTISQANMRATYVKVFYNRCALRPSCYECPYATTERKTDITIGDFWHIEETIPDFYNPNGNSLFLIHTNRGGLRFPGYQ